MPLPLRVAAAVAILALAGCVSPTTPAADAAPATAEPASLVLAECHQMHLNFPARAEDFASQVPEAFRVIASGAGMTTLFVRIDACTGDDPVSLMWIELPVEPAEELAPDDGPHALVIQGGVQGEALHAQLAAHGFGLALEPATASIGHPGGVPTSTEAEFSVPRGVYTFTTGRSVSSGAFGAETFTRWTADDGGNVRKLLVDVSESMNLGAGAVSFTYTGGNAAPPIAQGIAHEVVGATITITLLEVA